MNACGNNFRVDLELVDSNDPKALTQMQTKLNQWITTGQLIKFETHIVGTKILYTICRVKQGDK